MSTIYFLEDNKDLRMSIVEELIDKLNGTKIKILDYGNDEDFTDSILISLKNSKKNNNLFAILDIEVPITWGPWCKEDDNDSQKKQAKFGIVKFDRIAAHGWNVYNKIREHSKSILIVVLTSHDLNRNISARGGIPLPIDKHLLVISRRGKHFSDIADEIIEFFNLK